MEAYSASKLMDQPALRVAFAWLFNPGYLQMPLSPSALLHTMGSVTALCSLDEDTLLASHPIVEEVFLLKGEGRTKVVDSCADATAKFGIRFEDPRWTAHVGSLKPIGLACAIGVASASLKDPPPSVSPGSSTNALVSVAQAPPECMRNLAGTIGFLPSDVEGFTVLGRARILGRGLSQQVTKGSSWSVAINRAVLECVVVSVPPWQQPVNASLHESIHVLCWGHPSLLLPFCNEFWDGESIWTLDTDSHQVVKAMNSQWSKEVGASFLLFTSSLLILKLTRECGGFGTDCRTLIASHLLTLHVRLPRRSPNQPSPLP